MRAVSETYAAKIALIQKLYGEVYAAAFKKAYEEAYVEGYAEGREEGRAEKRRMIRDAFKLGVPVKTIAQFFKLSEEEVQEILAKA